MRAVGFANEHAFGRSFWMLWQCHPGDSSTDKGGQDRGSGLRNGSPYDTSDFIGRR